MKPNDSEAQRADQTIYESEAKTRKSCFVLLWAFLLSFSFSIMVGIFTGRIDLALATLGTSAAWIACVEGALLFDNLEWRIIS